jgi:hypothetical protein
MKKKEQIDQETGEVVPPEAIDNLPAVAPPPESGRKVISQMTMPPAAFPVTPFGKLATAISEITSEVAENPIHKKGRNSFHNYNYATMQDILAGLTPQLAKHGIVILQTEVERGFMDDGRAIFATYDFTVIHKAGEVWPFPQRQTGVSNTRTSKGTFDDKGLNKCHTSARKYFLLSLFQIPTTDEDDADRGDNDRGEPRKEPIKPAENKNLKKVTPSTPHEIPRPSGIKAVDWGRAYIEAVKGCETIDDLKAWSDANDQFLRDLAKAAPQVYDRVTDVEKTRKEQLEDPQ